MAFSVDNGTIWHTSKDGKDTLVGSFEDGIVTLEPQLGISISLLKELLETLDPEPKKPTPMRGRKPKAQQADLEDEAA